MNNFKCCTYSIWYTVDRCCLVLLSNYYFLLFSENVDAEEAKSIFESNFSHIYYILYDTFVTAEANLRQRGAVNYLSYYIPITL
jgi:hypothetical protein